MVSFKQQYDKTGGGVRNKTERRNKIGNNGSPTDCKIRKITF